MRGATALLALALSCVFSATAGAAVSNPPTGTRSILVFPQRDSVDYGRIAGAQRSGGANAEIPVDPLGDVGRIGLGR